MVALPPLWLLQAAVAAVWLYEGLWCKVLARSPHEFEVVEQVPFLARSTSHALLRLLGVLEALLGAWVLSGWQPVAAALVQTGLLIGLNASGIYFSARPHPGSRRHGREERGVPGARVGDGGDDGRRGGAMKTPSSLRVDAVPRRTESRR